MLFVVIAFAGGIALGHYVWRPPAWWMVAAVAFAGAAIWFLNKRPRIASTLALTAFVFAGAFAAAVRPNTANMAEFDSGEEAVVTAHVAAAGNLQNEGGSWRQQVDLETEEIESGTQVRANRFGLRLTVYSTGTTREDADYTDSAFQDLPPPIRPLRYGERVRFMAAINSPRNFHNPGAFDYAGYLREQGIQATASVKFDDIAVLAGFSGSRWELWRTRVRRSIIARIHRLWPEPVAGLIDAMVIGEKAFIERSERVDFQRSGTYHMLVVAGLHVGILAGFALWILRLFGFNDVAASVSAMAVILAYAVLTGEGAPVWRAALMFAVYLATRLLYRGRAMLNALAIAALCLLMADTNALFTASFQMSILCVALIAGIALPLLDQTIEPYGRGLRNLDALAYDRSLPAEVAQFRIDLRLISSRLGGLLSRWIARALVVTSFRGMFAAAGLTVISAVMQLGLALPMAYYFHRATSVAIPANLLMVPLLELLMPAAVLAIGLSYVSMWLASIPDAIAGFALAGISQTVHWMGGLRIADVRVPAPGAITVAVSAALILMAVGLMRRGRYPLAGVALLSLSAAVAWGIKPAPSTRPGVLEVTAIDVGQGDSLFLGLPDGKSILIDGGGLSFWAHSQMDIGEDVVSPYLWSRGLSRLDAVVLTHAHRDHMGGLPAIIANFRPRELWLPEGIPEDEIHGLLTVARHYNVKQVYRHAGDVFDSGRTTVRVLAPDPQFPVRTSHRNDESLVLKITYGNTSALLEADAEKGTEKLISAQQPAADLLQVAHHGSASSTNAELLLAVQPKFAVISAGARNVYHHPRLQVLERLQQAGAATYRTDINGASTFYLDGIKVIPQTPDLH